MLYIGYKRCDRRNLKGVSQYFFNDKPMFTEMHRFQNICMYVEYKSPIVDTAVMSC